MAYEQIAAQAVLYVRGEKGVQPTNRAAGAAIIRAAYHTNEAGVDDIDLNAQRAAFNASGLVSDALSESNNDLFARYVRMESLRNPLHIRSLALASSTTCIGNCEAMAALAFDWLARSRRYGARFPIELWQIGEHGGGEGDQHVVVVIGRTPGGEQPLGAWNAQAVVVDPWADASYPASELEGRMTDEAGPLYPYTRGHPSLQRMFRLDSNDDWPWVDEPDHADALLPTW
jgi:hypothetical protein